MSGDGRVILWTLLVIFCIVIIRCTEIFWTPCILLLNYLFLLTARFGIIVAFSCEISYCLTANYCIATIALHDKTIDTSVENITILLHSAVIVGKRNNVHNKRCVWLTQLVILGKTTEIQVHYFTKIISNILPSVSSLNPILGYTNSQYCNSY
jgi:hypothetical protein